jgi:hypothetical protein
LGNELGNGVGRWWVVIEMWNMDGRWWVGIVIWNIDVRWRLMNRWWRNRKNRGGLRRVVCVTPQVFSSIIALHCMSISMHHFMLFYVITTIVIVFRILFDSHHVKFRELV